MEGKTKKVCKKIILYMLLIALAILWIVPMFTLLATAVKSKADFYTGVSLFEFPENPAWGNFVNAFKKGKLFMYMKNDLIVSGLKVPLGIFIEALAAFALTRLKMRHRTGVFVFFLVGMMLPLQTALVPINVIYSKLGLLNTYFGLFYVYIGFGISFGILILRGFFRGIPREMDEAAYIDGCSKWQLFYRIILPVAKPAVATLVITDFLATWNEYLLGSVIINDNTMKTVPVGLMTFVGEHGTDYGYLCAGVLISLIPVLTVYLIFQRYFVEGMAGAVKM
ncbi:MAG: carbohydrate ABC transporter permease [Lachnospiraceae bacterium]|jgi:raffinose/stachyose/melibiose transport system permease protein|nr:carbohydrate ABC transporter permease [Lachnospiraceae bacterium]MCI9342413.1 carbohydrate ABC transporter permease [Lachnospiraceae bacterium]GFH89934.1 L-arabinose transport system permease protein AraQ [Lachnospiraceae bacterium]GFI61939.1 L-arabinose transport system permease protein AraQ [Clostridiales bacterium]